MNILIAIDSLKGSISSNEANLAVAEGFSKTNASFSIHTVPIADGGEGTIEALIQATGGNYRTKLVTGPLGTPVEAHYGVLGKGKTAVIEIAEACGLPLLTIEERNPLITTTYGVGELILDAIENGCSEFIVGLGGSATTDGGLGMLQALGFQFFCQNGKLITEQGGVALSSIHKIESSKVPDEVKYSTFRVACDVTNPLYGENGAAYIFGPQKGATKQDVITLDNGLHHFATIVIDQLGIELQTIKGAGAAGGLGAAFSSFLNAELVPGADLILQTAKLEEKLNGIDLVITGEGKLDNQTVMGKAPAGIASLAKKYNIPVIALAGDITNGSQFLHDNGIDAYFAIVSGPISLDEAMRPAVTRNNLVRTGNQIARLAKILGE